MRGETTTTTPSLVVSREEEEEEEKSLFESLVLVTENFLHDDEKERLAEFVDRHVQLADAGCLRDDGEEEEDKEEEEEEETKDDDDDDDDDFADDAFVSGTYFWSKDAPPRCAAEEYCETLARYVTERTCFLDEDEDESTPSTSFAGCEYWIQDVAHDEAPKTYHTDCVLERDARTDGETTLAKRYPLCSTVYYGKTSKGGATVVFDKEEYEDMRKCVVCRPKENRLLTFRGDMWHGVCRDDRDEGEYQRVTFLVNFWKERPKCAKELPKELCRRSERWSERRSKECDEKETHRKEISLLTPDDAAWHKMKSEEREKHFKAWEAQNPNAFLKSSASVVLIEYSS